MFHFGNNGNNGNNQTDSPRMVPIFLEACVDCQILAVFVRNRQTGRTIQRVFPVLLVPATVKLIISC